MNVEDIRNYCLSKKSVTESFPFDSETLVFKVMDKMFLLLSLESVPLAFNAKCNPEKAIALREEFPHSIKPGYHMSKVHWNTIELNGELSNKQLQQLIDDSYQIVVSKLPKKNQPI